MNRRNKEDESGGNNALASLFVIGVTGFGCGLEYFFVQYAIENYDEFGIVSILPAAATIIIIWILTARAVNNISSR